MMPWRKPAKSDTKAVDRVLVIQLGELGAFVRALAAAKAIREQHLGARITLLTHEGVRGLAEKCPYFDAVEVEATQPQTQSIGESAANALGGIAPGMEPPALVKLISRIRQAKYDLIYDLENSKRTKNYFHALKPWPPRWSGSVSGAAYAYLDPERKQLHPLDRLGAQLKVAGIGEGELAPPDVTWLRSALRDPPRLKPDFFGIREPYVVLLPRGSDAQPARRWPEAKYIEVAGRLLQRGVTPVVLGGPEERPIGAAVAATEARPKNLVTRADLFQSIGLFERAAFVLGDDVDLMHVAAASGASCLAFLSAAHPECIAPRGRGGVVAFTASVVADLPVEQVERQLRNCGVFPRTAGAA